MFLISFALRRRIEHPPGEACFESSSGCQCPPLRLCAAGLDDASYGVPCLRASYGGCSVAIQATPPVTAGVDVEVSARSFVGGSEPSRLLLWWQGVGTLDHAPRAVQKPC